MKTMNWNILKKRIPELQGVLKDVVREHPDFDDEEIVKALNDRFSEKLKELETVITIQQIRAVLTTRSYKKEVADFMIDIASVDPGEISKIFKLKLPKTSYEDFFVVGANPDNPRVFTINSPLIGLIKNEVVLTRALITAQQRKSDVVIITGNLIWMDLKKFSNKRPAKAEFSYEEESDKLVFRSFKDKFDILVKKLQSKFFDENGKSYFTGTILISLGKTEEDLIEQYTNEIIRRTVLKEQRLLRDQRSELISERKQATKDENEEQVQILTEEIEAVEKELSFVIMTNTNDGYIKKISKEMRKYIIYVYEKALNAKVISSGELFLDVGGMTFQNVTDAKDSTQGAIKKQLSRFRNSAKHRDLPHIICISGRTNSMYSGSPVSYVSEEREVGDSHIEELPCCIDNRGLIQARDQILQIGDPFLRAISSPNLNPGAVLYQGIREKKSGQLLIRRESYGSPFFLNDELFNASKWKMSKIAFGELEGDHHTGSRFMVRYRVPKSPKLIYHCQMAHDFLDYVDAPILFYVNLGDIIQGHSFPFEQSGPKENRNLTELLKNGRLSKADLL